MSAAVTSTQATAVSGAPQAVVKAPRWAQRRVSVIRHRDKTKQALINVDKKQHLNHRGGRPPRAKSTNDKPSKAQTCTISGVHPSTSDVTLTAHSSTSDVTLTESLSKLNIRANSVASNRSTTSHRSNRSKRARSAATFCRSLEDMARFIEDGRAKNIVVMCGAGISTASGIPDFRSPKTGLYANLKQYKIPYPESIFDLDFFEGNPKPFYTLAKELYPTGKYRPNYVHYFLRLLHEKGVLLRVYTQNIDGLERLAGIPTGKLVEAHGTFFTSSCIKCREKYQSEMIRKIIFSEKIPRCHKNRCLGLIKPDIVFFGEDLHRRFFYYLKDFPQADMLLVMGTSLEVEPFANIVDSVRLTIPRILFNRNAVGPFKKKRRMNDVVVKGDIAEQLGRVADMLSWNDELLQIISDSEKNATVQGIGEQLSADDKATLSAAGLIANPSSHQQHIDQSNNVSKKHDKYATGIHRISHKPKSVSAAPCAGGTHGLRDRQPRTRTVVTKQTTTGSLLPRLNNKPPAFHAQRSLYRGNCNRNCNRTQQQNYFPTTRIDTDSSDEESSETDDSDDD